MWLENEAPGCGPGNLRARGVCVPDQRPCPREEQSVARKRGPGLSPWEPGGEGGLRPGPISLRPE